MAELDYGADTALQDAVDRLSEEFKKQKTKTAGSAGGTATSPVIPGGDAAYTNTGGGGGGTAKASTPTYKTPTLPGATSQADYINAIYDADRQAQEANLRSAYEQQVANLDYQAAQIPKTYDAAANDAAIQAEIARRNLNQSAAGSGLNTGAAGQVALSQSNALQRNMSSIRQAQADAVQKLELERAQQEANYKNAINAAIAQNDLARAQALYQEAKRVDEANMNRAANQAQMDWTVWNALYNRR